MGLIKVVLVMTGILVAVAALVYAVTGLVALIVLAIAAWPFIFALFAGAQLVLAGQYYTAGAVVFGGLVAQFLWTAFQGHSQRRKQAEELGRIQLRHRQEQELYAAHDRDFDRIRNWDGRSQLKLEVTPLPDGLEHLG